MISKPFSKNAFALLRQLIVYTSKDKRVRFGDLEDGGYVLFEKALRNVDCVYSYGIGRNDSFDMDVTLKLKVKCHCYDHTIRTLPKRNSYLIYHRKGIGASLGTFSKHVIENNDNGKDILLKMDVEGAEWDFFESLNKQDIKNISQMTIELHGLGRHRRWTRYIRLFKKINKYYYLCHVHANNTAKRTVFDRGIHLPHIMEATFLRKDLGRCSVNKKIQFPTPVDCPIVRTKPDMPLTGWPYCSNRQSILLLYSIMKIRSFFNNLREKA